MNKVLSAFIIVFLLNLSILKSQECKFSQNKIPEDAATAFLDVEDKEIDMMVDEHKINTIYHQIFRTVFNEDFQEAKEDKKQDRIKSLKVAFLSSKLDLTSEESQNFWPIYNEYVENLKSLKNETNEIVKDEKVLDIRKKYKVQFDKILNAEKTNTLFKAEKEFKKMMQETILMQKLHKDKTKE